MTTHTSRRQWLPMMVDDHDVGLIRRCTPAQWVKAWYVNDWNTARVIVNVKSPHITIRVL